MHLRSLASNNINEFQLVKFSCATSKPKFLERIGCVASFIMLPNFLSIILDFILHE